MRPLDQHASLARIFPAKIVHVNYLVNWAVNRKIIYVETPKVGCTTIKEILQYSELDNDSSKKPKDVHDRDLSPLKSPSYDEEAFLECLGSYDYFTFSFVRNPFTRVISAYLDKIVGQPGKATPIQKKMGIDPSKSVPSFEDFVNIIYNENLVDMNPHWAPQTFLLGFENVKYDFLGRFEFFQESIDYLVSRNNLAIPEGAFYRGRMHATNASAKTSYYYKPRLVKRVQNIYHNDFKYLGYGWSL